ncbi:hypothetical protein BDW22DRAFT_715006 [Trametopsis cervina]|nr:hypothetical protein BDW22DRAFT_715006 [Trametopsis cervina]
MGDAPPLGRSFETDDQEEPEAFMLRMTSLQKLVFDFGKKPASDGTSENEIVISRLLLANHNSKNPRRFTLIKKLRKALHYVLETVDDGPSTLEAMDRWMIVANTLLIIASEREFLEPGDYIQEAYLRNIFSTLSVCLFGLTLGVGNIQAAERLQLAGGMRPLFRRVDDLFTNLWMRKELLVPRDYLAIAEPTRLHKTIGQDSVFRRTMRLACIAYMLFMLSPERLYRHMPFSNHIHNVLMYCWAHTRDRRESIYGLEIIHAAFMGQYFQPNAPTNGADVSMATSHFFQELAIPPAVLTERFVSMLTDHDVHDEVLWKLLHSYHSMFVVFNGSEILNPRSEALHKELASGLCVAAERQVCKSWKAKLEHVFSPYLPGYETNAELRVIYMTWMNLSEVIRLPWADGGSRVVDVVASGGIAPKIVQLMAYTIQYHAKAGFFDLFSKWQATSAIYPGLPLT